MSETQTQTPPRAVKRHSVWLAWTLITIGGLVAALCGGVSLFLGMAIFLGNDMSDAENVRWLLYYVLLGGVPALVGLAVFGVGILLHRRSQRQDP